MRKALALILAFVVFTGFLVFGYFRESKKDIGGGATILPTYSATPKPSATPPILSIAQKDELKVLIDKYNYTQNFDMAKKTQEQINADPNLITYQEYQKLIESDYYNYLKVSGIKTDGDLAKSLLEEANKLTK